MWKGLWRWCVRCPDLGRNLWLPVVWVLFGCCRSQQTWSSAVVFGSWLWAGGAQPPGVTRWGWWAKEQFNNNNKNNLINLILAFLCCILLDDFPESTGIKRIIQALNANVWSNVKMKDGEETVVVLCILYVHSSCLFMSLLEHSQSFGLMSSLVASRHNNPQNCQDPVVSDTFWVINSNGVLSVYLCGCSLLTYQQGAQTGADTATTLTTLTAAQTEPHRQMH